MSKRTVFTTVTPLPAGISRMAVMETLHNHLEMIDLNPLVEERHPIKPPTDATPEEYHALWYSLTDRVSYVPGGLVSGKVSYNVCFHDLERGLQTHCYAPLGLNIKGKWTLGGSLPGEPVAPVELGIGAPLTGLYIREDVDMRCNIMMTSFVKKTLKSAHARLVDRLVVKAQFEEVDFRSETISLSGSGLLQSHPRFMASQATTAVHSQSDFGGSRASIEDGSMHRISTRNSNHSAVSDVRSNHSRISDAPSRISDHPHIVTPEIHASPEFRGRPIEPSPVMPVQSPNNFSLTINGPISHGRSLSEQRPQLPYPDFEGTGEQGYRASSSGSAYAPQQPRLSYEEAVEVVAQVEQEVWHSTPPLRLSRNGSLDEDLDMAFQEAAPAYHEYAHHSPVGLSTTARRYGDRQPGDTMYPGVSVVRGAAELA